jgi:hypothetical protein
MNVHLGALEDKMISAEEKEEYEAKLEEDRDKLELQQLKR